MATREKMKLYRFCDRLPSSARPQRKRRRATPSIEKDSTTRRSGPAIAAGLEPVGTAGHARPKRMLGQSEPSVLMGTHRSRAMAHRWPLASDSGKPIPREGATAALRWASWTG